MEMKPETKAGLEKASTELRQGIVAFLARLMSAKTFVYALIGADGDLTNDGQEIFDHLTERFGDDTDPLPDIELNALYSAICEGRRDDAIGILSDLTGERFRSIREQRNLFPERVPL